MERRTGRLTVQSDQHGAVSFRDGVIVGATVSSSPPFHGRDAVFAMLGWQRGDFEFVVRDVGDDDTVRAGVSHLLLEHARLSDERKP